MQDIHDIRPPVPAGLDSAMISIVLAVLGACLLIALLFWVYRRWRNMKKGSMDLKQLPLPPAPFGAAMNALDLLLTRPEEDPRIFYFDLTLVLRTYMGDSFGAHAAEMTSQEFVFFLRKTAFEDEIKQEMIQFSEACDPYKYAGTMPEHGQVKKDIASVREMITRVEAGLKAEKETDMGQGA